MAVLAMPSLLDGLLHTRHEIQVGATVNINKQTHHDSHLLNTARRCLSDTTTLECCMLDAIPLQSLFEHLGSEAVDWLRPYASISLTSH